MKISSNIVALMTVTNMGKAQNSASKAMERLSSGLKINSAKDNPTGLAISNKLNTQVVGLRQANDNAMNGISLIQTAEGALNEVHSMLNRIRDLTVQGVNGTLTTDDREKIQIEIDELMKEIEATGQNTEFNKKNILDMDDEIQIQIGANSNQVLMIDGSEIKVENIMNEIANLSLENDGDNALTKIDNAVEVTSRIRATLGATQNRLEHITINLGTSEENTTASLSRVQDADMAEEMTNYTQYNVISQAGIAMLAQANQRPQQVLQLLNS